MAARDVDDSAATYASAAAIGQRLGTWTQWGRRRRRLVALTVANRLALVGWFIAALAFEQARLPLLAVAVPASVGLDCWLRRRLQAAEEAEGAFDEDGTGIVTADELELHERLQGARSDRHATLIAGMEVLTGTPLARRYALPTRELLMVRSVSEAIELIGVAIVALTAPAPVGMAVGIVLWVLGGRTGVATAKMLFGQHLYRSPVDDDARERWLDREDRLIMAACVIVLLIALLRLT